VLCPPGDLINSVDLQLRTLPVCNRIGKVHIGFDLGRASGTYTSRQQDPWEMKHDSWPTRGKARARERWRISGAVWAIAQLHS
jgi:hypothetical protein